MGLYFQAFNLAAILQCFCDNVIFLLYFSFSAKHEGLVLCNRNCVCVRIYL